MTSKVKSLREKMQQKELSCVEITRKYLDAIENEKEINSYITVTEDAALETAGKVDEKIAKGEKLYPLEGIPMSLKDNISTKGIRTTCASKMLENYVPIFDAFVWEKLQAQNAVLLGKTNLDEFAMGSTTESSYFGTTLNPHNKERVSGGSSGGSAASVAANTAVYGLCSDTGGSIRQPASFCGVVGLKPTYGAISRFGCVAFASSFDQVGVMASNVYDTALVYDAIKGYDPQDATSTREEQLSSAEGLEKPLKGIRIGIAKEYFQNIDEEVKAKVLDASKAFQKLGAELVDVSLNALEYALPVYYILSCAEASSNLARFDGIRYGYKTDAYQDVNDFIMKNRTEAFGVEVKRRILLGTYVLSSGYYDAYYKKAQNLRGTIVAEFDRIFSGCDFLLAPTVSKTAFPLHATEGDPVAAYMADLCTVPVNIAGLPGLNMPCGFDAGHMPVGMQLIGPRFTENMLLNAAYQYEKENAGHIYQCLEMGVNL